MTDRDNHLHSIFHSLNEEADYYGRQAERHEKVAKLYREMEADKRGGHIFQPVQDPVKAWWRGDLADIQPKKRRGLLQILWDAANESLPPEQTPKHSERSLLQRALDLLTQPVVPLNNK